MATPCPPIVHAAYIEVAPARVFETLTSAAGWDAWFTSGTLLEPRQGGRIVLRWKDWGPDRMTTSDSGAVVEIVPNERFAFLWHVGESVTKVAFELQPRGEGTVVRLKEIGYKSSSEQDLKALIGTATGWGEALTLLKMFLEHGIVYGDIPILQAADPQPLPTQLDVDERPAAGRLLDAEA